MTPTFRYLLITLFVTPGYFLFIYSQTEKDAVLFQSYIINPNKNNIQLFWKDEKGNIIQTFSNLNNTLQIQNKKLIFAMNGGMFTKEFSPLGLYMENGKTIHPIYKKKGKGNFYLEPNGVLVMNKKTAQVVTTNSFKNSDSLLFATQSGPMLVIDGKIHASFNKDSKSLYIRNGVGILPNGHVIFAISNQKVNFYTFAKFFLDKGCKNALYLDGYVSAMWSNDKIIGKENEKYGVIIALTRDK